MGVPLAWTSLSELPYLSSVFTQKSLHLRASCWGSCAHQAWSSSFFHSSVPSHWNNLSQCRRHLLLPFSHHAHLSSPVPPVSLTHKHVHSKTNFHPGSTLVSIQFLLPFLPKHMERAMSASISPICCLTSAIWLLASLYYWSSLININDDSFFAKWCVFFRLFLKGLCDMCDIAYKAIHDPSPPHLSVSLPTTPKVTFYAPVALNCCNSLYLSGVYFFSVLLPFSWDSLFFDLIPSWLANIYSSFRTRCGLHLLQASRFCP